MRWTHTRTGVVDMMAGDSGMAAMIAGGHVVMRLGPASTEGLPHWTSVSSSSGRDVAG